MRDKKVGQGRGGAGPCLSRKFYNPKAPRAPVLLTTLFI